jgi:hypothetical protein
LWRHVLPQVRGGRLLAFEMVGYGESIPAGRDRDISVARQADYSVRGHDGAGTRVEPGACERRTRRSVPLYDVERHDATLQSRAADARP